MTITAPTDAPPHEAPHPSTDWESQSVDLGAYLRRIGYDGSLTPTVATLRALQRAHLETIPFENLEIMVGGDINLDIANLQERLVGHRRGGYCHQHNILFGTVLDRLGFRVTGGSARMLMGADESELTAVGHTILRVRAEGTDWHVDVGVGNVGPREPVPLVDGVQARHGGWDYRLDRSAGGRWVLRLWRPDGWFPIYQFSDERYFRADFADHNYIASTHPKSPFTRRIVAQYNGAEIRHTLTDRELTTHRPGQPPTTRQVAADDLPDVLRTTFGLELTEEQERALVRRARSAGAPSSPADQLGT